MKLAWVSVLGLYAFFSVALDTNAANSLGDYYQRNLKLDEARKVWNQLLQSDTPSGAVVVRSAKLILYQEGRGAALQFLRAVKQQKKFSPSDEALVNQCEREIIRVFLTDEGQALYLRAKNRMDNRDFVPVADLLYQALRVEGGQALIYEALVGASCLTGQCGKIGGVVKSAYDLDPASDYIADHFFEMKVGERDFAAVIDEAKHRQSKLTIRQRTALAYALNESGRSKEAYLILQGMDTDRQKSLHPIVWFVMGKYLNQSARAPSEGTGLLKRFMTSFSHSELFLTEGYDPYPSQEKLTEAKRLIPEP